jgi:hypothetical protein
MKKLKKEESSVVEWPEKKNKQPKNKKKNKPFFFCAGYFQEP